MKRSGTFRRVMCSGVVMLVAMGPTVLSGQATQSLSASVERVREADPPPPRVRPRDSLRDGAATGAVIGAAAFGALAATICHAYREPGGPSCVPDALRFAAIGGAIGLGAGIAIDAARSSGPMVRLTLRF